MKVETCYCDCWRGWVALALYSGAVRGIERRRYFKPGEYDGLLFLRAVFEGHGIRTGQHISPAAN